MKVAIFLITIFVLFQAIDMCDIDIDCDIGDGLSRVCRKKRGDIVGECVFGCLTDGDCPLPLSVDPTTNSEKTICSKGICVAGCKSESIAGESEACPRDSDKPRCNTNFQVEGTDIGKCDVECRSNEDCRLDASLLSIPAGIKVLFLHHTFCIKQTGRCGQCRTNADCVDLGHPICSEGTCVTCTKNTECTSHPSGKLCKATPIVSKTCGCESNADCTNKQFGNICDQDAGICSCNEDTDCKVKGFQKCAVNPDGVKVCGQCNSDQDCGATSTCLKEFMFAKCVLSDCSSSSLGTRVVSSNLCGCRDDSDCANTKNNPFTPACDCALSKCVACTRDIHCKSFERCNDAKKCAPLRCNSDFDCFRQDLIELGRERTNEARCADSQKCVERVPVCVDSIVTPGEAKATEAGSSFGKTFHL